MAPVILSFSIMFNMNTLKNSWVKRYRHRNENKALPNIITEFGVVQIPQISDF